MNLIRKWKLLAKQMETKPQHPDWPPSEQVSVCVLLYPFLTWSPFPPCSSAVAPLGSLVFICSARELHFPPSLFLHLGHGALIPLGKSLVLSYCLQARAGLAHQKPHPGARDGPGHGTICEVARSGYRARASWTSAMGEPLKFETRACSLPEEAGGLLSQVRVWAKLLPWGGLAYRRGS